MTADSSGWCESIVSSAILECRHQDHPLGFRYNGVPNAKERGIPELLKKWDKGKQKIKSSTTEDAEVQGG